MTEEEFVFLAEKYGIRAGEPVRYNPYGDTYTEFFLAGKSVGKVTDCVNFGEGVQGRAFVLTTKDDIKDYSDTCYLSDMTEEKFRRMLERSMVTSVENAIAFRNAQSRGLDDINKLFSAMRY